VLQVSFIIDITKHTKTYHTYRLDDLRFSFFIF